MLDKLMSDKCPKYKVLKHWLLRCPAILLAKKEIFGRREKGLEILTLEPRKAIILARRTLLMA